jgi:hypothetical protein
LSTYSDLILAEASLQSYWRLDETAGSPTVADSKGSITGTIAGSFTLGATGLLASDPATGGRVTASPSRIEFGDNYPFTGTAAFSVEVWMKPDAAALAANAIYVDNQNGDGWLLRILAAGAIRMERYLSSAADTSQSANGVLVADNTYHVVCTYDGTDLRIYSNGALVAGPTTSSKVLIDPTTTLTFSSATGGGNQFTGYLDEFAIYNAALSAGSVLAHYDAGVTVTSDVNFAPVIYGRGAA